MQHGGSAFSIASYGNKLVLFIKNWEDTGVGRGGSSSSATEARNSSQLMRHPLHDQWSWPLKLPFWQEPLSLHFTARQVQTQGPTSSVPLLTSAGDAEATTPAAMAISHTNRFIAPYQSPEWGSSSSWQHQTCAGSKTRDLLWIQTAPPQLSIISSQPREFHALLSP